jgi:hypothetical protein
MMQIIENNEFLSEISHEESATISGGNLKSDVGYEKVAKLIPELAGKEKEATLFK